MPLGEHRSIGGTERSGVRQCVRCYFVRQPVNFADLTVATTRRTRPSRYSPLMSSPSNAAVVSPAIWVNPFFPSDNLAAISPLLFVVAVRRIRRSHLSEKTRRTTLLLPRRTLAWTSNRVHKCDITQNFPLPCSNIKHLLSLSRVTFPFCAKLCFVFVISRLGLNEVFRFQHLHHRNIVKASEKIVAELFD